MAIGRHEVYEAWSRNEGTWSYTDSGSKWTYVRGSGAVSSHHGIGRMTVRPNTGAHIVGLNQRPKQTEREILVRFSVSTVRAIHFGIALNHDGVTNTHYRVATYGGDLRIQAYTDGWTTGIGGYDLAQPLTPGQEYWIRARYDASENRFKAKIWHVDNAEPGWLVNVAPNPSILPVRAGYPAMYALNMSETYTIDYKVFYVWALDAGDTIKSLPVTDNFDRGSNYTWGMSTSRHLWEGTTAYDPAMRGVKYRGGVNAANSFGLFSSSETNVAVNAIGPTNTRDSDVTARVSVSGADATMRIGLRGWFTDNGSQVSNYRGYFAQIRQGTATVAIAYINNGSVTTLGTATLPQAVADGVLHRVRIQAVGTTIRMKAWRDGTAEPAGWMITTTHSALTSGSSIVTMHHAPGRSFRMYNFSTTLVTSIDSLTVGSVTRTGLGETTASFRATYRDDENLNGTVSIVYRAEDSDGWQTGSFGARSTSNGVHTRDAYLSGLYPDTNYTAVITFSDPDGVDGTETHELTFRTRNNSALIPSNFNVQARSTPEQLQLTYQIQGDENQNATSRARVRPVGTSTWGSWVNATRFGWMFEVTIGNLIPDTEYEVQIEISDDAGVRVNGSYQTAPWTTSRTYRTIGRSIQVMGVTATPTETTALIMIEYKYDLNDDATFDIQFRSAHERLFTNVNPAAITINRQAKSAYTTLSGLKPATSYEVIVYPHDPDGLAPDTPSEIRTSFNTKGTVFHLDEKGKQYVYRIYDPEGEFIGTWPDAPDPEFSWGENGGVNDLRITLPRTFASLNYERTINFNNRVDVWALDGTSQGMGSNLIEDENGDKGGWVLTTGWTVSNDEGADGSPCLKFSSSSTTVRTILSEPIRLGRVVPIVLSAVAKATGGKLRMDVAAYDKNNELIDVVDENAETINVEWQKIAVEWLPPSNTSYLRVRIENDGKGTMLIGKVELLVREMLIYRGEIDEFNVEIGPEGEQVTVDVLGYPSYLSDDYIEFLQFVAIQPQQDIDAGRQRQRQDPTDPANMLKQIIDIARKQNPRCPLYYTEESIKPTGVVAEYTFRDKMLRDCFDKVVEMCPPNWYYVIDPDGCVWLQSSEEHATVHKLRLNVEVSSYQSRRSIRQLKNVVQFKGRQDEDGSEPDGYGTIRHTAQDPQSIKKYGRRVLRIQDAQVTSPDTAEIIAEGRLEEHNVVNESGTVVVPDEKDMKTHEGSLRGYNIQSIRPGDRVLIIDPETGPNKSFWDQFKWDEGEWDAKSHRLLTNAVPVKQIQFDGTQATLELAHLPPTTRGDFARMVAVMRRNMSD